jgi:hypothetical protein
MQIDESLYDLIERDTEEETQRAREAARRLDKERGQRLPEIANRPMYYILKDDSPVPASLGQWVMWFSEGKRVIKQTELNGFFISTVFLGLDHGWRNTRCAVLHEQWQ